MRSQSLMTPAMFIVSALVFPMSRNTACTQPRRGMSIWCADVAGHGACSFIKAATASP